MMLSKAITAWIAEIRPSKAPDTCRAYESALRRLAATAKHDSVLAFTKELVSNHLLMLSSIENASMATLHTKRAAFGQFAKWGVMNGLWKADPLLGLPKIKRPKHLPRPFTNDEIAALWALELPPMQQVARGILFMTGLRVTPVCKILLGHISYNPPFIRAIVKGNKVVQKEIPAELAALIQTYVLKRANSTNDLKGQTHLFRNPRGGPMRRQDFEEMVAKWGKAAGVADCTPHRFRHSFATKLLESTKNLRLVQEALDHEDIASTTIYTRVVPGAVGAAVRALEWTRLLPPGSVPMAESPETSVSETPRN
ncbi:MAG TPA: tyrosine-type recombinase/integrase [Terriglobales bacterium]|nr:tyrosine-type recombinase/integrase [Terriglobales bacterium]